MSPLRPIPSRVERIEMADGASIEVRRWRGEPDLVSMLLLPTRPELTAGYESFGAALAARGVSMTHPLGFIEPGAPLGPVAALLARLRDERGSPPVVLAGHGLGGLVAVDYLESDLPQPDVALLIGPTLGSGGKPPSLFERLVRRSGSSDATERVQARVSTGFDRIRVRTRIDHGFEDAVAPPSGWFAWQRLPTSILEPGDTVIVNRAGHDLPNDPAWRHRVDDLAAWLMRWARERWPEVMPPPADHDRWRRMSRAEAMAEFEALVAGEDERLSRFSAELARRGGPEPRATREGMAQLGAWLLEAVEAGPREGDLPDWVHSPSTGPMHRLSADSLWLIDGAAADFAASLRALEPSIRWELCTERIDAYYHRALLEPIHLVASLAADALISELNRDEPNPDWLGKLWDAWVVGLEQLGADPHALSADPLPLDEIAVDPYDDTRWNAQVWIPEGAEAVLGERRFERLADQVRRLKGVQDLAWEDREVMLVRLAPGVDHDDLRRRIVGVVQRARRAAGAEQ